YQSDESTKAKAGSSPEHAATIVRGDAKPVIARQPAELPPPPAWRGGSGGEAQTTRGAGARGAAPFAGWLSTEHGKQSASRWDPAGAGPRPRLRAQAAAPSSPMRAGQRRSNVAFTDGHVKWGLDSSRRASLPAIAAHSDAQRRASGGGAPSSTARGKKL